MSKKKGVRLLLTLMACMMLVCSLATTAFACSDGTDPDLPPVYDESDLPFGEPDAVPDDEPVIEPDNDPVIGSETNPGTITSGDGFTEDGNAYIRDLLYDKNTNKQFIVVQTKNGNTFYVIIDYDKPLDEDEELYQTYFLNLVDERDLADLLEENDAATLAPVCTCTDKCVAGAVDTSCAVCKNNMSECLGVEATQQNPSASEAPDTEPEAPETTEKSGTNVGMIVVLVLVIGAGGGAYYYIKFVRGKKQKDEDLDFFDDEGYEEEPYINEDEDNGESDYDDDEPDIVEDDDMEDYE